jgi:large subunit ribosomal protein L22
MKDKDLKSGEKTPVRAKAKFVKGSIRKLLPIATAIRGMKPSYAVAFLRHLPQKAAKDFEAVLVSCIANAENNYNRDIDSLVVHKVLLGKSLSIKRVMPRARGSAAGYKKYFVNLTIELI